MRQRKRSPGPLHNGSAMGGAAKNESHVAARAAGEEDNATGSNCTKRPEVHWRHERVVELILMGVVMGVYMRTLYPSVAGGDSGELVAESCHLGISHPPGYPLFNMLVYLVTNYTPGSQTEAWKANAFSAACDALAAVVMYRTLLLWTDGQGVHIYRKTAAFTASALFAFSPLIWTYAVGAEVFALNNLFAAALIHTLLQYSRDRSITTALKGALLSGLAMCNQHTIVLFELPIISWVLYTRRHSVWGKELLHLAAAFTIGLLPYVYMPITARWHPQPGSWGDLTSLSGFFHHLRRADYGTFRLFSTNQATEDLWTRLCLYAIDLSSREAPFHSAVPLAIIGLVVTCRSQYAPQLSRSENGVGRLVATTYVFYMLVFHALANLPLSEGLTYGVHMRFWQQPNVIVFLWIGVGLHTVMQAIGPLFHRGGSWLLRAATASIVIYQLARWFSLCDQSQAYYIRDYASALLDPLPVNALLFVNFDLQWTALRYLQRCEHRRRDVTILNYSMMTYKWFESKHEQYPHLRFPGARLVPYRVTNGFSFAQFLDANRNQVQTSGVFFGGKLSYDDGDFHAGYQFVPFGLLDQIQPLAQAPAPLHVWYNHQQHVKMQVQDRLPTLPPLDKYDDQTWEWTIARDHGMKQLSWATFLLDRTITEDPHNLSLLAEATLAMEHSYQHEPPTFWAATATLKNLGLAYAQIVKSKHEFPTGTDPFYNSVVGHNVADPTRLKDRASARMLEVWDAWLGVPGAESDPGYAAIEGVVRKFLPASESKPKRKKTSRKRKTKKKDATP